MDADPSLGVEEDVKARLIIENKSEEMGPEVYQWFLVEHPYDDSDSHAWMNPHVEVIGRRAIWSLEECRADGLRWAEGHDVELIKI